MRQIFLGLIMLIQVTGWSQNGQISGRIIVDEAPGEFAQVFISGTSIGTITNDQGYFELTKVPLGEHTITASFVGFQKVSKTVTLSSDSSSVSLNFELKEKLLLDEVVVTGTKTAKRKTNSPVIVNVINSETLNNVQACNLSEGLRFQPGLRVETDCQTCNYTQLRMNGLAGGYSQILINGRPIFSPLTGLYGMEQLPVNMIDRIEVIRGGGSSLYGSSAVGGTVNVITKIPQQNSYELNYNYQNINGGSNDHQLMGNATVLSQSKKSGLSLFLNHRDRTLYDHNGDNFSELPALNNTSVGINTFFLPTENQKLELSFSNLNEYRYGGEMVNQPAHLALQSEERTHNVYMASLDYQINFNDDNSSLISYLAWQNTDREHYTGILPDGDEALETHLENPPYGTSQVSTYNVGLQLNHKFERFLSGSNVFTLGSEYIFDDVYDEIPAYNYLIDQTTKDLGLFIQSDWELLPQLSLLSGVRMDVHNLIDGPVFSPRVSLLYKHQETTQLRLNYGTGFRAPQAFDTDLHIAFAGGGVSRISLSPDLIQESSQSLSGSINFDKPAERFIYGFTLEGFYTRLDDAFYLQPVGEDEFGERFVKQNGQGATVSGATAELRANYNGQAQLEAGFTLQRSVFDNPVQYIDGLDGIRSFVRTPNDYGFAILTLNPTTQLNANVNYVYTGQMKVPHFAGAPNQTVDEIITSDPFHEVSLKVGYTLRNKKLKSGIEFYGGIKNVFNAYQNDFDIGKNRDSNFVYGPAQPRTFFVGLKIKSL